MYGGPWGTVPELLFEKKRLIPALQRLLISYVSLDCKNSFQGKTSFLGKGLT